MSTAKVPSGSEAYPVPGHRQLTLPEVVFHMRCGRTAGGELVRPYRWLDYAGGRTTPMELKVMRVMESCTLKSGLSCVLGEHYKGEESGREVKKQESRLESGPYSNSHLSFLLYYL